MHLRSDIRDEHLDLPEPGDWERLTSDAEKIARYSMDLYFLEGWSALYGNMGARAYEFAATTALAWLRPDAFHAGAANRILVGIRRAGFTVVAGQPIRLDRHGVRALWAYELKRATAERMALLDGLVDLGPGLVVLCRLDGRTRSAAEHLTALKGANDPEIREPGSLRDLAGSPNRLLTMLHTASDAADVVRELAVFTTPDEMDRLLLQAERCERGLELSVLDAADPSAPSERPGGQLLTGDRTANELLLREALRGGTAESRWRAIEHFSQRVPLLKTVLPDRGEP